MQHSKVTPIVRSVTVHLLKPGKGRTITYQAELLQAEAEYVLVLAHWDRPALDLGYVVFEPGDQFYEYYYTRRWFNIFAVYTRQGRLKGWYCNVTRPAELDDETIRSEDLELDLFVSPDRATLLRLDLDEFAARDFAATDPSTHAAALAALDELEHMARAATPPFDRQ